MNILSVDPSINNVGLCLFRSNTTAKEKWKWNTLKLEGHNIPQRLQSLQHQIAGWIGEITIHKLLIEYPTFFSSEKGAIAARNNYTVDLACICGFLFGKFCERSKQVAFITATQWKGTVSKEITMRKFFRKFRVNPLTLSEHSIDACMLLHYWLFESSYGREAFEDAREPYPESPL